MVFFVVKNRVNMMLASFSAFDEQQCSMGSYPRAGILGAAHLWCPLRFLTSTLLIVSATPGQNLSPHMPLSSGAEVLWTRTEAAEVADAMT